MAGLPNSNLSHEAKRGSTLRAKDTDILIAYLHECFDLDDAAPSGLRWKHRPLAHFGDDERVWRGWNARWAGKPAGTMTNRYWCVELIVSGYSRPIKAHRVIFALTHGKWPSDQLDHENRNKAANRLENLREATNGQNQQNTGLGSLNTSGFKGVSWDTKRRKWFAFIMVDGRQLHLGYFIDTLDAIMARLRAERIYYPFRARPQFDPTDVQALAPLACPVTTVEQWKLVVRGAWGLPPRIHFRP